MKKLLIYASIAALTTVVVYLLCKKGKSDTDVADTEEKNVNPETNIPDEISQDIGATEEMYKIKNECAQAVYERHFNAGSIMKDAYSNIMEDFVEDFSDENDANEGEESKEVVLDSATVSVTKEIDSISDELDELLKQE